MIESLVIFGNRYNSAQVEQFRLRPRGESFVMVAQPRSSGFLNSGVGEEILSPVSKLLVIGMGPLLDNEVRHFGGQCLRTWHFARPLFDDGHSIRLVTLPIFNPDDPAMHNASLTRRSCEGIEYQAFTNSDFGFIDDTLRQIAQSFVPDGIIAVNLVASWVAARLPLQTPLWADLNGYEMAEKQGQAARIEDDDVLLEAWRKESLVARRADKFSTVSRPQLHALLGEMNGLGRMNRHTFHYHFAHHIPNAFHSAFAAPPSLEGKPILRGDIVPPAAFVLLWSGGYNYWTDPDFLYEFLESAMELDPRVHFVSTGGAIEGYNTITYERFVKRVNTSPHRERYHLLGWVPAEDLPAIYREADLGLNIDEMNYETFFGARNRLNNLMAAGLPILTTSGSEISFMIEEAECGIVCPPGDMNALRDGVAQAIREPEKLRQMAEKARSFTLREFAPEQLIRPVRDWARKPRLAPDNAEKLSRDPKLVRFLDVPLNRLEESARIAHEYDLAELRADHIDLTAIRSKLWYRTLKTCKNLFR